MKSSKILVLYKKTAYSIYKGEKIIGDSAATSLLRAEHRRLRKAHDEHHQTYEHVIQSLKEMGVAFKAFYRGREIPFRDYDIVLTIGGDGTFLKASSFLDKQLIIGINSAPSYSVGRLCTMKLDSFQSTMSKVMAGRHKVRELQRIELRVGKRPPLNVLNDVLIAHSNPAVLSRYSLKIAGKQEEQRSSGIWVSTPVGSSGAIGSAGGKQLPAYAKKFQYLPRELYEGLYDPYKLVGGVLGPRASLNLVSLMPKGRVYVDGGQNQIEFPYGEHIRLTLSKNPIRTLPL